MWPLWASGEFISASKLNIVPVLLSEKGTLIISSITPSIYDRKFRRPQSTILYFQYHVLMKGNMGVRGCFFFFCFFFVVLSLNFSRYK